MIVQGTGIIDRQTDRILFWSTDSAEVRSRFDEMLKVAKPEDAIDGDFRYQVVFVVSVDGNLSESPVYPSL